MAAADDRFRQLFESAPDAVLVADQNGAIILVNSQAEQLFGYGRDELVGQSIEMVIPQRFRVSHVGLRAGYHHNPHARPMHSGLDLFAQRKDGSEFPVEVSLSPINTTDGMMISSAIRDVSARKQIEREIDELHRGIAGRNIELAATNHELEAFTSAVAHDLRAPLRYIQQFAANLIEDLGPEADPSVESSLRQIAESASETARMVDDLLSLVRLGRRELNPQVTALSPLVSEVIRLLAPDLKGRQVEWRLDDLPSIECDAMLTKQVFVNLLSNAVKYTAPRQQAIIEVGCWMENGEFILFVKDNGVGFNMKYADKLFNTFQRLHRREEFEGFGVGLAAVQRIVQKHGGRIWAEAEVDQGAAFFFTLSKSLR